MIGEVRGGRLSNAGASGAVNQHVMAPSPSLSIMLQKRTYTSGSE